MYVLEQPRRTSQTSHSMATNENLKATAHGEFDSFEDDQTDASEQLSYP